MIKIIELDADKAILSYNKDSELYGIFFENTDFGRLKLNRFCGVPYDPNTKTPYRHDEIILFENQYYTPSITVPEDYQFKHNASPHEAPLQWISVNELDLDLKLRTIVRERIMEVWDTNNSINLFD